MRPKKKTPKLHPIEQARRNAGWSRIRLAAASHISPSYVNLLEKGKRQASPIVLRDLSLALKVPIRKLMTRDQLKQVTRTVRIVTGRLIKARG